MRSIALPGTYMGTRFNKNSVVADNQCSYFAFRGRSEFIYKQKIKKEQKRDRKKEKLQRTNEVKKEINKKNIM
jgi:hypothetical protein